MIQKSAIIANLQSRRFLPGVILSLSRDWGWSVHYERFHCSPNKLVFQNTTQAGDQKLMIDLEWP